MRVLIINNLLYPNPGSEMYIVKIPEKWRIYGIFREMGRTARAVFISLPRFSNSR